MTSKNPFELHLTEFYGIDRFRSNQLSIIEEIFSQPAVAAFLPTGTGKTLLYQFPTTFRQLKTVVISPLISLIMDQYHRAKKLTIPSFIMHGQLSPEENSKNLSEFISSPYGIIFLSPERWNSTVKTKLSGLNLKLFVVVDEAHCISTWGTSFRKDYLQISYPITETNSTLLILSATPTPDLLERVKHQFDLEQIAAYTGDLFRSNLQYDVIVNQNKMEYLVHVLSERNDPSILYVQNRQLIHEFHDYFLSQHISCTIFHAGLTLEEKHRNHDVFFNDRVQLMIATSAYGMGIDKPNIRNVFHFELPLRPEDYIQETGRAGRDGKPSKCRLIIEPVQINQFESAIKTLTETESLIRTEKMSNHQSLTLRIPKQPAARKVILKIISEAGIVSEEKKESQHQSMLKLTSDHYISANLRSDIKEFLDVIVHVYSGKIFYTFISVDYVRISEIMTISTEDVSHLIQLVIDSGFGELKDNANSKRGSFQHDVVIDLSSNADEVIRLLGVYRQIISKQHDYLRSVNCLNQILFSQLLPDLNSGYRCGNCGFCMNSDPKSANNESVDYLINYISENRRVAYKDILKKYSIDWNCSGDHLKSKKSIDSDLRLLLDEGEIKQTVSAGNVILSVR